ncbi:MAG: 7-cyano-7-deazaguanine synthase QueC [Parachlamydiaceae bacterium]|nr:7-cyano-7-deazaguanine synthase QueC [Parachlamydiaceae bacterium]
MSKKAIVIHSGGMDSSLCLALAAQEFGPEHLLSLSFSYHQRHSKELEQAKKICQDWKIDHHLVDLNCLNQVTHNALMDHSVSISLDDNKIPNTLVIGRNGLMAHFGAIYAHHLGAHALYMGVMELEEANSGYRDCSRHYMDLKQEILRIDLDDPIFEIRTPLVKMTKKQTLELADQLGILEYLLKETVTCYEGLPENGCLLCPACQLRNQGIREFLVAHPNFKLPYSINISKGN